MKQKTLVAIPCYNEEKRLSSDAFLAALDAEPNLEFVFVNDGSTDGTLGVLEDLQGQAPGRLRVVNLVTNSGKAEAVRQGVLAALEADAELVGYWDADLATPLEYIARFARELEDDSRFMVFGSRVRLLGHHVKRSSARHYVGRGFATVAGLALDLPIYDTQCGAKLFRAGVLVREVFADPFELDWCFDVEIFARLLRCEMAGTLRIQDQCMEYPLEEWADAAGSKLTPGQFPRIFVEILRLLRIAREARAGSGR